MWLLALSPRWGCAPAAPPALGLHRRRRSGLPGRRAPGPGPLRRPAADRDAADPAGWCTGARCRRHPLYSWPGPAQWGLRLLHAAQHCRVQRVQPVAAGLRQRQLEPHGSGMVPHVLVHNARPPLRGQPPAGLCARGRALLPVCTALAAYTSASSDPPLVRCRSASGPAPVAACVAVVCSGYRSPGSSRSPFWGLAHQQPAGVPAPAARHAPAP